MTKRNYIRIISFFTFGLSVLVIYCSLITTHLNNYKVQLESNYQQSLVELNECLNSIETDLNKSLYSNSTGEIYDLSRDIYSQCATAKNAISRLPISQMNLQGTYKFLSQAGDYSIYMGDKLESDKKIDENDQESLYSLLTYAQDFSNSTNDMISIIDSGGKITESQVISDLDSVQNASTLTNSFTQSENTFDSYPTLLYDGPFSDQKLNKTSVFLEDKELLSEDECRYIAAKALNEPVGNINFSTDQDSTICCYNFKCGRYFIAITKNGGYVKSIMYSGFIENSNMGFDEATDIAKNYLVSIGYENMEENYYTTSGNICTINFEYCVGDTYYYPDLIKVSVSLEDGSIVGLDANTYLMNHKERTDFKPKYSSKDAEQTISPFLEIVEVKKCVIPEVNGKESPCWEFRCRNIKSGYDALIYINTQTLVEEEIQLLLYSDNGILVK